MTIPVTIRFDPEVYRQLKVTAGALDFTYSEYVAALQALRRDCLTIDDPRVAAILKRNGLEQAIR